MMRKTKIATAAGIAALALAGTGAGVAMADTSTSAPKPPATADAHHKHGMLGRIEHGEVTVGGAKPKVIDLQRGTVQKVDANSITVRSKDGFVGTYVVNGETKVHKEKAQSTISKVTTGDQVRLRAVKNGATATAKMIGDRGPAKH